MAREHAQIKLAIWADDDFRALPVAAQHLYFVLMTSPTMSHCGVADWRPNRIAAHAQGWTTDQVQAAADVLIERLYILVDTDTEEVLLRSFVRNDGLMKQPKMAAAMANAHGTIASTVLRGVVVHELTRLRDDFPDLSGWGSVKATELLSKRVVDPSTYPLGKGSVKGSDNPSINGSDTGSDTPLPTPNGKGSPTPYSLLPTPNSLLPTDSLRSSVGKTRARSRPSSADLNGQAHSKTAHTIAQRYAQACDKRPPTSVLNRLGPRIDALLAEEFTPDQINAGFDDLRNRSLGLHLLETRIHELAEADANRKPDPSTEFQLPTPPRELLDDHAAYKRWCAEQRAAWEAEHTS